MATKWDGLTVEERFWEKVNRSTADQCWEWAAATNEHGYGVMTIGAGQGKRTAKAHRLSVEIHDGVKLSPRQIVMHECDNPPCVNPAHLLVGTQRANIADAVEKRRHKHGERGSTKLSAADTKTIRKLLANGAKQADLAQAFGVSPSLVSMINTGKRWAA